MNNTYIYKCDDCGHTWSSKDYNEEASDKESDYANGAECPKCGSENIGGTQV